MDVIHATFIFQGHVCPFKICAPLESPASRVFLVGDWSAWLEQHEMQRQADGTYSVQVPLPRGRTVRFKFMVNGIWTLSCEYGITRGPASEGPGDNILVVGGAYTDPLLGYGEQERSMSAEATQPMAPRTSRAAGSEDTDRAGVSAGLETGGMPPRQDVDTTPTLADVLTASGDRAMQKACVDLAENNLVDARENDAWAQADWEAAGVEQRRVCQLAEFARRLSAAEEKQLFEDEERRRREERKRQAAGRAGLVTSGGRETESTQLHEWKRTAARVRKIRRELALIQRRLQCLELPGDAAPRPHTDSTAVMSTSPLVERVLAILQELHPRGEALARASRWAAPPMICYHSVRCEPGAVCAGPVCSPPEAMRSLCVGDLEQAVRSPSPRDSAREYQHPAATASIRRLSQGAAAASATPSAAAHDTASIRRLRLSHKLSQGAAAASATSSAAAHHPQRRPASAPRASHSASHSGFRPQALPQLQQRPARIPPDARGKSPSRDLLGGRVLGLRQAEAAAKATSRRLVVTRRLPALRACLPLAGGVSGAGPGNGGRWL